MATRDEEYRSLNLDAHQAVTRIRLRARALADKPIETECDNLVDTLKVIDEIWLPDSSVDRIITEQVAEFRAALEQIVGAWDTIGGYQAGPWPADWDPKAQRLDAERFQVQYDLLAGGLTLARAAIARARGEQP